MLETCSILFLHHREKFDQAIKYNTFLYISYDAEDAYF